MRLLITGGTGQLGRALHAQLSELHELNALSSASLDVTNIETVHAVLDTFTPDLVIHAGAMTDVDGCEQDIRRAFLVNGIGTQHLAAATGQRNTPIVYVSTNFIFDGDLDRPYLEFDTPNPISVYGASKLAGERAVQALNPKHFIARTSMVYDETGRNFVNTMLRLASTHPELTVVDDQRGNPTYATDLAAGIVQLIRQPAYGIYHLTNQGSASWYEWAKTIFETSGIDIPVRPIPASEFKRAATPPANGDLDNLAAASLGIELPDWRDALGRCLARRADRDSAAS